MAKIARTVSGLGLVLCLGLAFVPPACGGRQAAELSVFHGSDGPTVPAATVSKLQACADRIRDPLKEITYTFHFQVEVAEDGHVDRVKHKESVPTDPGIESCLADALEGMRVPASAVEVLTQQREQAELVAPSSRGLMGDPMSAGAALLAALAGVELTPVVLVAGAVTVAVGVTIYVGEKVIEKIKQPRPESCDAHRTACLHTSLADLPGSVAKSSRCLLCYDVCTQQDAWPSVAYSRTNGRPLRCDYWNY